MTIQVVRQIKVGITLVFQLSAKAKDLNYPPKRRILTTENTEIVFWVKKEVKVCRVRRVKKRVKKEAKSCQLPVFS